MLLKNTPILLVLLFLLVACGGSTDEGPSVSDIPVYPNADEAASMQHTGMAGMGGNLKQYETSDSYDDVVNFYKKALSDYEKQIINSPSELGRQVAASIMKENGILSVAIQEFTDEQKVHITIMEVNN